MVFLWVIISIPGTITVFFYETGFFIGCVVHSFGEWHIYNVPGIIGIEYTVGSILSGVSVLVAEEKVMVLFLFFRHIFDSLYDSVRHGHKYKLLTHYLLPYS